DMLRSYVETDQTARISLQISINVKEQRQQKQPVRQSLGDPANPYHLQNQPRRRRRPASATCVASVRGYLRKLQITRNPISQKNTIFSWEYS
ncbi:hypothetical protein, partial [Paenirhodobacter populi]|uniref:hypothetical protein n=1 Tax=Paenirhodobacter populi TaxID=2306993 RepID=UPI0019D48FD3